MQQLPKIGLSTDIIDNYQTTFQYIQNNNLGACQLCINRLDISDILLARKYLQQSSLSNQSLGTLYTCFHSNITHNLAGSVKGSADPQYNRKITNTKQGLLNELDIATAIGSEVVVHVGWHYNTNIGLKEVIKSINEVLIMENCNTVSFARRTGIELIDFKTKRKILLENSAGKNNSLGNTLEEMSIILSQINPQLKDNVGICIDTCHAYDAGKYDFGNPDIVSKFYNDVDTIIPGKLKLFHLNDSMHEYGSCRDNHQHLTQGHIFNDNGINGLKLLIKEAVNRDIPMIGEYPQKYGNSINDMNIVRELLNKK